MEYNEILRNTSTITMVDNDIKVTELYPNPSFTEVSLVINLLDSMC